MKRCQARPSLLGGAVVAMTVLAVGCAAWESRNEAVVRVETSRDPSVARRLTLAGVEAFHAAKFDRAAEKFLAAIGADDTYGPAHNNLGLLHYNQGNLYQAVLAFERAMELMPADASVVYNLALTLEAAGKVHEALDLYWQAIELDPVNPVFLGNLVRLRVRLGESGPELTAQLQDLVLIETRPDWRRWADRQLALNFNDALDRGPATPDFDAPDAVGSRRTRVRPLEDRVIDLSAAEDLPPAESLPLAPPIRDPNSRRIDEPYVPRLPAPRRDHLID